MAGARNSKKDTYELQEAHRKAGEIVAHIESVGIFDANNETPTEEEEKALYLVGSEVKALGNGKIGGYLVRFSSKNDPDLTGDFFTAETDFGDIEQTNVLYHHGMDGALKTRSLGSGKLTKTDVGIWIEAQLKLADDYEKAIYEMVKAGKLKWSSGTAQHLVERQPVGEAMWIKSWPLGLDASVTPTPAEPRNAAIVIKSQKEFMMEPKESETPIVDTQKTIPEDHNAQVLAYIKSLEAKIDQIMSNAPPIKSAGVAGGDIEQHFPRVKSQEQKEKECKAWDVYVREGIKAALREGVDSEGGYLVPELYSNELLVALTEQSVLRRAGARVLSVSGTDALRVPIMTHSGAAVLTSEASPFNQQEPTFGEVVLHPYKYTKLVQASDELVMDTRINLMSQILIPDFTYAFAQAENAAFATADGVNKPEGITVGASDSGVTTASATSISADNIIEIYHSLGYLYRGNAVWLMNDSTVKAIRKLKSSDNQYLWQPGLQSGQPDLLLGRPIYTLNTMPELGVAGNRVIVFGDMRYFWIVDFGTEQMRRLDELYAATGQVGFRMYRRFDSQVMLSEAIKYAKAGA